MQFRGRNFGRGFGGAFSLWLALADELLTATQFWRIARAGTGAAVRGRGTTVATRASATDGKGSKAKADNKARKAEADSKSRRYDPAETRALVLEAAYLLFGTRGYAGTGTADIAAQADVSEGSIFYHFGSKRALLVELGKLHGQKLIAAMQGDDLLEDVTFTASLSRCFDFCEVHNVREKADACSEAGASRKINKQNPEAEPFFHAAKETVVCWTQAHLEAVLAKQGISGISADITSNLIFSAVGEAMHLYFEPGTTTETKARIRGETIRFCDAAAGLTALQSLRG